MFIQEIEIYKILGCESAQLRFHKRRGSNTAIVIQAENDCPIKQAVTTAVQLICSSKYAQVESLANIKDIHRGWLRIIFYIPKPGLDNNKSTNLSPFDQDGENTFTDSDDDLFDDNIPTTSQQGRIRELRRKRVERRRAELLHSHKFYKIEACRNFTYHAELITYSVNDGKLESDLLPVFHGKFFTNVDYILPNINNQDILVKNWMRAFATDMNIKWNDRIGDIENPFEDLMFLFLKKKCTRPHFMVKLAQTCLLGNATLKTIQKTYALRVLKDVRQIFEYLTYGEYTVWFFIPQDGQLVDLHEVVKAAQDNADNIINVDGMKTYIQAQNTNGKVSYLWINAEEVVRDLLLISLQLALAFHCRQSLIYLQRMEAIKNYQILKETTSSFLETENNDSPEYLQRIIDVCVKLGITAIIEYPGGIPIIPRNAHILKCFQVNEGDENSWNFLIRETDSSGLSLFIEHLRHNIKFM